MNHTKSQKKYIPYIIVIGVIIIPLLYSYFYLGAFWDPYSNLDQVPVAVVNEDQGANINDTQRNLGNELCEELKEDGSLAFTFTDADSAKEGLERTTYYAVLTIPTDFSANIASASNTDKQVATVTYSSNEKSNYLATQILNSAVTRIEKSLRSSVDEELVATLTDKLNEVPNSLGTLSEGLTELQNGASDLKDGTSNLSTGAATLNMGAADLATGITSLKDGADTLASGTTELKGGASQLVSGSNSLASGASSLQQGVNSLSQGIDQVNSGAAALATGASTAVDGATTLKEGTDTLATAAVALDDGASKLYHGLEEANDGVTTSIEDTDSQLASLNGLDTYAADPVAVDTEAYAPVPNYGTAFAPYFMSLSLWVGGLMIFFGIYFDPDHHFNLLSRNSELGVKRSFAYLLIGLTQAVLLCIVLLTGLKLTVTNLPLFIASCCLISMTFIAIIQLLLLCFSNIGKFLAIALLILQLTSCGGTFPMETVPRFYNMIYPFMPMTYSVGLFKEAISGTGDSSLILKNVGFLLVFLVGSLLLTLLMLQLQKNAKSKDSAIEEVNPIA